MSESTTIATFAAGCFWGVEEAFRTLEGVEETRVGYTGGHTDNVTYEQVCSGESGHTEAVEVEFDPEKISFKELLEVFWKTHDPTQLNRQGPDVGSQYRSGIYFHDEKQQKVAESSRDERQVSEEVVGDIVTEILPAEKFWAAEEYHQQYLHKRGKQSCRI